MDELHGVFSRDYSPNKLHRFLAELSLARDGSCVRHTPCAEFSSCLESRSRHGWQARSPRTVAILLERRAIADDTSWSGRGPVHPLAAACSARMDAARLFWERLRRA